MKVRKMDVLKNKKSEKLFESVIFSIVGIICFTLSFFDICSLCNVLAGICLIIGLFYLFGFFYMLKDNNQSLLTRSIILILLSLIIVLFQQQFIQIIPIVICVFLIYFAIQHFSFTLDIKTINEHHWIVDLIYSLIIFLGGIVIIIIGSTDIINTTQLLKIGGILYLVAGITKILLVLKLHPSYSNI